jgi:hypothetical protein
VPNTKQRSQAGLAVQGENLLSGQPIGGTPAHAGNIDRLEAPEMSHSGKDDMTLTPPIGRSWSITFSGLFVVAHDQPFLDMVCSLSG